MKSFKLFGVAGFTTHTGKIAVVPGDNIDTDRIIPARFLSRISRFGYGELLFSDVRGPEFPLDQDAAQGASILVVGNNFGCGSSREHAVWAIQQAGFKVVISRKEESAPGFADIFRQNSANCGLLLIEVPVGEHLNIASFGTGSILTVDLPAQQITWGSHRVAFEINPAVKTAVMEGLDLIGTSLKMESLISSFEANSKMFVPAPETLEVFR